MKSLKQVALLLLFAFSLHQEAHAQDNQAYTIPLVPNPTERLTHLKQQWAALQGSPISLGVRDCFSFLLDALDTKFLTDQQVEWVLDLVQTRVITDSTAATYGNIYWGWTEKNNDAGDGNNAQFCVQSGILIRMLFEDRLSVKAKKSIDLIFEYAMKGVSNQPVRVSYTNIYVMRIWNLVALGQVYGKSSVVEEGRTFLNIWLKHLAHFGNREYDSPTYSGVALESLLLLYQFSKDPDIKTKAKDALNFLLTDLCSHYNESGGFLGGAHSRDYNRVFSRDLLEEEFMNPILGRQNTNNHLVRQICFSIFEKLGLSPQQKELMQRKNRFIVQRWDSIANSYACDFAGNKVSIASSNQAYSPDDKSFVMYLSSARIRELPNIVYVVEGRDDHYGTWSAEGMGEKMKHLMPDNYPANGGWGKTRHLMPFMQCAQNRGEFVMLVSGDRDHNCIKPYLNSTIILPDSFDEIWLGNNKIKIPVPGASTSLDETNTFFARFEDVVIAFRILWDDAGKGNKASLYNDGFRYESSRENFRLVHNAALRLTLRHSNTGKAAIAMWWKTAEGIKTGADFFRFRQSVLNAPVEVNDTKGIVDISVATASGKLGVKADIIQKKRLAYYNPVPLPAQFLFNADGLEIGKPILEKYR